MCSIEQEVRQRLFALQDPNYKAFHCKLIPTVEPDTVIGVRTPELRKFAREFSGKPESADYLKLLPHQYYDENNLHGFLIERMKDYDAAIAAVEDFLPYIDNWATCDLVSPKVFRKHLPELYQRIRAWLQSDHTYTVRFGIGMLMSFYLDNGFQPEYLKLVSDVRSQEYYVNMMMAWYFATALAKQNAAALPYLQGRYLDKWTHNKAIQKALESSRIPAGQKTYLRTLKIK